MKHFDRLTTGTAWRRLGVLICQRPLDFVAYLLLNLLLRTVAVVAIVLEILCTCCLAGGLMMIPYLGAVVLLPVTYFFRVFSLAFLEQVREPLGGEIRAEISKTGLLPRPLS